MTTRREHGAFSTLEGFPDILCATMEPQASNSERVPNLQKAARKATSAYILLWPHASPSEQWCRDALNLLNSSQGLAAVTAGKATQDGKTPTLQLVPTSMLIRRDILRESGGLHQAFRGVGDGIDLGWRLWLMGYQVVDVPAPATGSIARNQPPLYLIFRNWLWLIVRNCGAQNLGWAVSEATLHMLAWANRLVETGEVIHIPDTYQPTKQTYIQQVRRLRDRQSSQDAPFHRVPRQVGEVLTVFNDSILLQAQYFRERKALQRLRRRTDKEIQQRLGQSPLDAVRDAFLALAQDAQPEESD